MLLIPKPGKLRQVINAKTRPIRITETEIRGVLSVYDLGELRDYSQPAVGSTRSQNLILRMGKGKKVLKQYKYSLSLEAVSYEHSVLRHLASTGFAAPRLVLNKDCETCTALEGKHYAVTDFIAGFKYCDFIISRYKRRRFVEKAARALARYHQLIDGFAPAGKKTDGFMPDGQRRWRESDWYLKEFEKYESLLEHRKPKGTELERFFLRNMDRFRQDIVDLGRRLSGNDRYLPKLVIHGDYGPYNLLFDGDELTAVLDFECTHLDWRADEVVSAIYRFAGTKNRIDYDLARVFLSAYQARCTLTAEEVALMPDIFRFSRLRGLAVALRDYFELAAPVSLRRARLAVWWGDWMEENANRLTEELLRCRI